MIDELTLYNLEVKHHNLKDMANAIEEMVRAEVIEELFNIHCKDVSQNECDGYGGRCSQCKLERLQKRAEQLKEQK